MKGTLRLLIPSLLIPFTLTAQNSLQIVSWPGEGWGNTDAQYIQVPGSVENTGSTPLEVKVVALELDVIPGTLHYFCWERCYEPGVLLSPTSLTLAPGEIADVFYGDYVPEGQAGISTIKYCFFNAANEADSVCGIIRYNASPLSVTGPLAGELPGIGKVFPNPASQHINVDYTRGNGRGVIEIYSILGTRMRTYDLTSQKGRARIPVDGLPTGVYLMMLKVDGEHVRTRKFHVSR
jgi:hypothetical protein